jgi:hypothetical protein
MARKIKYESNIEDAFAGSLRGFARIRNLSSGSNDPSTLKIYYGKGAKPYLWKNNLVEFEVDDKRFIFKVEQLLEILHHA